MKTNYNKLTNSSYKVDLDEIFPVTLIGLFRFELCTEQCADMNSVLKSRKAELKCNRLIPVICLFKRQLCNVISLHNLHFNLPVTKIGLDRVQRVWERWPQNSSYVHRIY